MGSEADQALAVLNVAVLLYLYAGVANGLWLRQRFSSSLPKQP